MNRHVLQIALRWLLFILCAMSPEQTAAQSSGDWSSPINLAAGADFASLSMIPKMAADVEGNVHVVWGAWSGPNPKADLSSNTIFYAWWNGTSWSRPIDVLASASTEQTLVVHGIATTADGRVVVLWSSDKNIMVSQSVVGKAGAARAWQTAELSVGPSVAAAHLAIDTLRGRWTMAYALLSGTVALTYSGDNGNRWSAPINIWNAQNSTSAPSFVDLDVSADGSAHAVWSENTAERGWNPVAIWRARVTFEGKAVPSVQEVARSSVNESTIGWPSVIANAQGGLHLLWDNGVSSKTGRLHQWSDDNGASWSRIEQVFPNDLSGLTGQAGLAFDSANRLHVVTSAQARDGSDLVLRYAVWNNGQWTSYSSLWPSTASEHPSLVVTEGNRLHLIWRDETHNMISYASRTVDSPRLPRGHFTTSAPTTGATPGAPGGTNTPVAAPTTNGAREDPINETATDVNPGQPFVVLLWGLIPVGAILGFIVVYRISRFGTR